MQTISYSRTMLVPRALSFPTIIIALVLVRNQPREIFDLYSTHGGFAWLLLHFCWPWVGYVTLMYVLRRKAGGIGQNLVFAIGVMLLYSLMTIPVSIYASEHLASLWGQSLPPITIWRALNSPFSLLLFFIG